MRLYRVLLLLYPRTFRARYGGEMVATFRETSAEGRYLGAIGRLRFWTVIARDLAVTVGRARLQQLQMLRRTASGRRTTPALPAQSKRSEMDTILQDVRYALRQFARRPGFAAVAILSLALAIGGNTAIYGILDGFVFHPFSYPDPDRLVGIGVTFPKLSADTRYVEVLSPAEYEDIRGSRSFASVGAFDLGNRNISGGDVPERVFTALVLDDLFPVFGMQPVLGRGFTREELAPNGPPVAIISHRLWRSRFGGDPAILTRPIRIGGQSTSVVGVMPPGLVLIGTDLWIPWGGDTARMPRNVRQFTILGRLAPGVSLDTMNAELSTIAATVDSAERGRFAEYAGWRLRATPWAAALLEDVRPAAYILLVAVALVLLIACANLTNLFLARSTTRHRELAVRLALGAGRTRIARHLLTESLLLAFAGAAAGLLLANAAFHGAGTLIPAQFQMLGLEARLNARVLWWSIALAAACGFLVALLPAIQATRTDPQDSLKADGRAGIGRGGWLRQLLVVAEIALCVVLLLGAGLLVRSVWNIQRVDQGFSSDNVLTMRLTLPRERYRGDAVNAFFDNLLERIDAVPGVRATAAASQFPPMAAFNTQFTIEHITQPSPTLPTALITVATPRYFDALGVSLRAGRFFAASDTVSAPPVAIVNNAFAARYLQGVNPIGQRVSIGSPDRPRPATTIVGVIGDFRNAGATQPVRPELYIPVRQQTEWNQLYVLVRSDLPPESMLPAVRQAVVSLDPEQPVYQIQTLDEAVAVASFQQRTSAVLLGLFAALALVLAAVGIYGVMSYSVSARTQEMGIRFALGAQRGSVLWLVMRQVLLLAAAGLAIGLGLLVFASRGLEGLLFGVNAIDPTTIAVVAAALASVGVVAAWFPASRASRVDPVDALRYE
jgi:putative ABC transport system permease protein